MKNPQRTLGLAAGEPIHIVPISRTVAQARRVVFGGICKKLNLAKWFYGRYEETMEEVRFRKKGIYIVGGASQDAAALGLNVICSVCDECIVGSTEVMVPDYSTEAGFRSITAKELFIEYGNRSTDFPAFAYDGSQAVESRSFIKEASFTDVFEVNFANGRSVTGTDRHPFLVRRPCGSEEYVFLRDLRPGDQVVTAEAMDCTSHCEIERVNDSLQVAVTTVLSIRAAGRQQTYDLYNPTYGNFIANGVVVHNTNFMGEGKVTTGSASAKAEDKATMIYNALARRVKGRYWRHGVKGLVMLVSSKRSTGDFTERRIRQAASDNDAGVFVRDYAIWNVHPEPFATQKWYRVAVSPQLGRCRLLEDAAEESPEGALVFEFPEDYLDEFRNDPDGATRDIAGVATNFVGRLFITNRYALEEMFDQSRPNLFKVHEWTTGKVLGIRWDKLLHNNANGEPVPICCPDSNRHVHIDISTNHCATGFCIGHRAGAVEVWRRDPDTGEKRREEAPVIHIDAVLRITAPDGGDIDHGEVRGLVYRMVAEGLPIRSVSMDQYMSPPNLQLFKRRGLRTAEIGDRTAKLKPYLTLRQAIYEGRVICPQHPTLALELRSLELDESARKVIHPPRLSKDLADALAGVVYWISENTRGGSGPVYPERISAARHEATDRPHWSNGDVIWPDDLTPERRADGESPSLWIIRD